MLLEEAHKVLNKIIHILPLICSWALYKAQYHKHKYRCRCADAQQRHDNTENLRHIIYSEFSKLYNFSLPAPQAVQLANISEKYLKNQVERGFTTLDFYHSLGV